VGETKYENTGESSSESASIASFFQWDDIDFEKIVHCGKHKCFYYSSLNNATTGYVIWDPKVGTKVQRALEIWKLAKKYESIYNIRHFLLGPPFEKDLPKGMIDRLNKKFIASNKDKLTLSNTKHFKGTTSVIIQPNQPAPEGSFVVKCHHYKSFFDELLENRHEGFAQSLQKELASTIALAKKIPHIGYDFQLMIDRDGKIYHLDFGRFRISSSSKKQKEIIDHPEILTKCLEEMSNYIKERAIKDVDAAKEEVDVKGTEKKGGDTKEVREEDPGKLEEISDEKATLNSGDVGETKYENTGESSSESASIASFFQWDDIDFEKIVHCGKHKCFYYSSLNNATTGYVIWDPKVGTKVQRALEIWKLAKKYESIYNIRHFLLGPPFEKDLPKGMIDRLNKKFIASNKDKLTLSNTKHFKGTTSVIIQPNQPAPEGSFVVKCHHYKSFFDELLENRHEGFAQSLQKELASTIALAKKIPHIGYDFQLMIDRDGKIYHLDFGRFRISSSSKKQKEIIDHPEILTKCLEEMSNYVKKRT